MLAKLPAMRKNRKNQRTGITNSLFGTKPVMSASTSVIVGINVKLKIVASSPDQTSVSITAIQGTPGLRYRLVIESTMERGAVRKLFTATNAIRTINASRLQAHPTRSPANRMTPVQKNQMPRPVSHHPRAIIVRNLPLFARKGSV